MQKREPISEPSEKKQRYRKYFSQHSLNYLSVPRMHGKSHARKPVFAFFGYAPIFCNIALPEREVKLGVIARKKPVLSALFRGADWRIVPQPLWFGPYVEQVWKIKVEPLIYFENMTKGLAQFYALGRLDQWKSFCNSVNIASKETAIFDEPLETVWARMEQVMFRFHITRCVDRLGVWRWLPAQIRRFQSCSPVWVFPQHLQKPE